jgi:hypothetical protein
MRHCGPCSSTKWGTDSRATTEIQQSVHAPVDGLVDHLGGVEAAIAGVVVRARHMNLSLCQKVSLLASQGAPAKVSARIFQGVRRSDEAADCGRVPAAKIRSINLGRLKGGAAICPQVRIELLFLNCSR